MIKRKKYFLRIHENTKAKFSDTVDSMYTVELTLFHSYGICWRTLLSLQGEYSDRTEDKSQGSLASKTGDWHCIYYIVRTSQPLETAV